MPNALPVVCWLFLCTCAHTTPAGRWPHITISLRFTCHTHDPFTRLICTQSHLQHSRSLLSGSAIVATQLPLPIYLSPSHAIKSACHKSRLLAIVLSRNHHDIPLLTMTHTQSACLSQFCITSICSCAHHNCVSLTLSPYTQSPLCYEQSCDCFEDCFCCANLRVRTVSALCCMRTSIALPFASSSCC